LLLILGGLVVIALFVALIGPYFVNRNDYKSTFEAEAEKILGQPVRVVGTAKATVLPSPSLTFTNVQVGDTEQPFRRVEGDVAAVLAEIEAAGAGQVWLCGGGDLAAQALAADRVDEVVVTVAPTVLGAGPALFDGERLPARRFRLAECQPAGGDAARLRWTRDREAAGG